MKLLIGNYFLSGKVFIYSNPITKFALLTQKYRKFKKKKLESVSWPEKWQSAANAT